MAITAEEARAMPGAFVAYRRTDGELIYGEYAWLAEHFECGMDAGDDADEIEEVIMVPVRVRVFPCHEPLDFDDDDDEAAVASSETRES